MNNYSLPTKISYIVGPILIIVSHIGSLLVFATGLTWGALAWVVGLYLIRMLATTGIYHRLLTHRSYQAPAPVLWLGSIVAAAAGQMGPSWWKAHHVSHHRYADHDMDAHSPHTSPQGTDGFYWSQGGWLLSPQFFPSKLPADVERDVVLRVIDRLHFMPLVLLGVVSYAIGGLEYLGAFFLSTTILFHAVQTVNSLSHLIGDQPFVTSDQSRNNMFVALITLGEGWHNFHHAFQLSARNGVTIKNGKVAYLFDPTFAFIKLLEFFKLATKLKAPTEASMLAKASGQNLVTLKQSAAEQ